MTVSPTARLARRPSDARVDRYRPLSLVQFLQALDDRDELFVAWPPARVLSVC